LDLSWITPALIVALLSLWIAFFNYRRSNYAIVRIRECAYSFSQNIRENGGQTFGHFRIVLQNVGIPLHNLHMTLHFNAKSDPGRFSIPLKAAGQSPLREGQFAKGMITEFALSSHRMEQAEVAIIATLDNTRVQDASLSLYADGFLVWHYSLSGAATPIKRFWNGWATKLNFAMMRRIGTGRTGNPIVKDYGFMPTFTLPSEKVLDFTKYLRRTRNGPKV